MSGLPIERAKIAAFTLGGFFAGCGGLFLAIQTSSGNADIPQAGAYTLNSIASVVIGGTSLLGGTGSVLASAVGALFLSQLQQFVLATGASAAVQNLVQAGALALAVTVYGVRPRRLLARVRAPKARPPAAARSRDGTGRSEPGDREQGDRDQGEQKPGDQPASVT
jgi:ribose/xylose/arabinose/galactoside ABC-type transport system permease subunit